MYDFSITTEDRLEIQELYARYCHYADAADGPKWALCFTPDGTFIPAMVSGGNHIEGRDALSKFPAEAGQTPHQMRHWTNNLILERDGPCIAATYYAVLLDISVDGPPTLKGSVTCKDLLERHEGRWLLKRRQSFLD